MVDENKKLKGEENGTSGGVRSMVPAEEGRYLPSTEYRESVPQLDEEVDLRDYLDVLLRRKWLIISVLLLVFVSTAIFTLTATRIYKAEGTIEVNVETPKVTKFEEVVATDVRNLQMLQTQVGMLQSETLARRVAEKMHLTERLDEMQKRLGGDHPGLKASVKDTITGWIKGLLPKEKGNVLRRPIISEEEGKQRSAEDFIRDNLDISPRRNSMLIDVSFTSPDRRLSQDTINVLTDEFVDWQMEKKLDASQKAQEFLMLQIDRARISLEKSEEELNRFAKRSGIVSLDSKLNSVYRQLEEVNSALAGAESELIGKRTLYEQAVEDGPSRLSQAENSTVLGTLKEEYAKLYAQYQEEAVTFRDAYPAVKSLKKRMESIAERIREEEQRLFENVKSQYQAARKKAASLRKSAEEQKKLAMELNERATQYKILDRQVQTNKGIYQSLLERSKEIESMVGVSASNIHVVDSAALPLLPYKPKVLLNLLLAIVVGLVGGIGLAFFVEYFADTITNPEEISERFQIPILGLAPFEKTKEFALEKTLVNDPRGAMSEALRTVKVSIQLSRADMHSKSFLVTSASAGEGKTTMAINMAQAFAQSDEKVVLLDADLRKPRIHKVFAEQTKTNGIGLSSLLAGLVEEKPLYKTDIENLEFIPAGPIPPNPVELLASNRFAKLIESLEEGYDRVIVDAPPSQGFADVLVLARQVGGVVLVTSLGEATREAIRHFRKSILNIQGNILGCIINKVNFSKRYGYGSYYRYYGHYYNYDYYGEGKKKKRKRRSKGSRAVNEDGI